jgi:hypothetical protein
LIPVPTQSKLPSEKSRKVSERDFVFDGEARVLAELNQLDIENASPDRDRDNKEKGKKEKVAVPEEWSVGELTKKIFKPD